MLVAGDFCGPENGAKISRLNHMKKTILFALFFIVIFYFIDLDVFDRGAEDGDWDNKVSLGKCEFRLEFVIDNESRQAGLSNRDSLCEDCGMLFEFPDKGRRTFWMKDMRFDLDIIWLEDFKVVGIEKNIPYGFKGTLPSPASVNRVLEINAGKSDECNIEEGSVLEFVD